MRSTSLLLAQVTHSSRGEPPPTGYTIAGHVIRSVESGITTHFPSGETLNRGAEESLALSPLQVRDSEFSAHKVPRPCAQQVIQLLAIGRDGRKKPIAFRGDLPIASRVVEPHGALARADGSDKGAAVGSEFDSL